ncbi:MAG: hypothetical protein KDK05_20220 [Candidatus Competibacteraceae bacterium]|nr:hypothetical protein [Candidatus Competibacteraceae bacterium]
MFEKILGEPGAKLGIVVWVLSLFGLWVNHDPTRERAMIWARRNIPWLRDASEAEVAEFVDDFLEDGEGVEAVFGPIGKEKTR